MMKRDNESNRYAGNKTTKDEWSTFRRKQTANDTLILSASQVQKREIPKLKAALPSFRADRPSKEKRPLQGSFSLISIVCVSVHMQN